MLNDREGPRRRNKPKNDWRENHPRAGVRRVWSRAGSQTEVEGGSDSPEDHDEPSSGDLKKYGCLGCLGLIGLVLIIGGIGWIVDTCTAGSLPEATGGTGCVAPFDYEPYGRCAANAPFGRYPDGTPVGVFKSAVRAQLYEESLAKGVYFLDYEAEFFERCRGRLQVAECLGAKSVIDNAATGRGGMPGKIYDPNLSLSSGHSGWNYHEVRPREHY